MARPSFLILGIATLLAAPPALAQSDPAARSLIDQLRPQAGQTRGIRLPGAETAPPPAPSPAQPAVAAPPAPSRPAPARPAVAPAPPPPAATTAPAGIAAVSITVRFATGSATLSPAAERELAPLGRALASPDLAPYRFRIEGHTDTVGTPEGNRELSERRAAAVRAYLVRRFGVGPDRLEAVGLGETQLLVPTGDQVPEGRNRRVQVLNIGG